MNVTSNAGVVAREFLALDTHVTAAVDAVVYREGVALQTRVKANASGRPGPRAQTGDYRRQIRLRVGRTGGTRTATVETDAAQAWRLEMGFWGQDSLGRMYRQPAYPHFGPAADEWEHRWPAAVEQAVARAFGERL